MLKAHVTPVHRAKSSVQAHAMAPSAEKAVRCRRAPERSGRKAVPRERSIGRALRTPQSLSYRRAVALFAVLAAAAVACTVEPSP
eukprot:663372-Prymnesium_polylepis.1